MSQSRPKADLYECHGSCKLWKPASAFIRKSNKLGLVYSRLCKVCRRQAVAKWLSDYYQSLRDDPVKMMEAINKFDEKKPRYHDDPRNFLSKFYKWLMAKNSLLARLGLIEKKGFDIVEYVMRKVEYGRITIEEAEERIRSYYERHPESRPVELPIIQRPNNSEVKS